MISKEDVIQIIFLYSSQKMCFQNCSIILVLLYDPMLFDRTDG